jgi:hypothetical protein
VASSDAADLVEAALRKALSAPRLSGYKPRRFAAGDQRGGEFAPKGMGTVAYAAVKDALDSPDRETGDVVWSSDTMRIVSPRPSPESRPEWKPSMTRAEAEQWRAGTVLQGLDAGADEFYHGTHAEAKAAIEAEGFKLGKSEFGRLWGDGVYLAPEFKEAHDYAVEVTNKKSNAPENVITVFPRVTSPALLDMDSQEWRDAKTSTVDDRGFFWFRESVINYFDLHDDFEHDRTHDGIERSGSFMQWVTSALRKRGHDALVVSNAGDHGRTANMVVVFDPENVVAIKDAKPPKWAQRHYGMIEAALSEAVRSPRLRGYVPKRYAKGTVFGGRFLPKGVSPFSAPSAQADSVDDRVASAVATDQMLRAFLDSGFEDEVLLNMAYGEAMRGHDAHGPDFLASWSESVDVAVVHGAPLPIGTIARDVQVEDGRRVRVMFDRETFSREDDSDALDEYFAEVEAHLGSWAGKAPDAETFPPYVLFTDKRSPSDEEMSARLGGVEFQADATADGLSRGIVFWNLGGMKHMASVIASGYVANPEILDHEIGHSVGYASGPPDPEAWAEAVNNDIDPDNSRGVMFYAESLARGQSGYFVREYGVSEYANMHMVETRMLHEDWAESVRIYMKEQRTGQPHYVVGRVPEALQDRVAAGEPIQGGLLEPEPMWFREWSPEKYAIVRQFIEGDGMVEAALNEAIGRVGSISSGMFNVRDAMYLKGSGGRFVGSRGRPGRGAVAADASRALSSQRAQRIAQGRTQRMMQRQRGEKAVTLGVTPFRGAGAAQGEDYYETTRYKGFVNDIGRFAEEEGVSVKSIERVRGVWRGGGEPSAAVTLFGRDESVRRVMDRLGSKYNQDGVISFRESDAGKSFRFRSETKVDRAALETAMLDEQFSDIAGATILPDGRVEFINIGTDEGVSAQIETLAALLGIDLEYHRGNAELRLIEEDYPRRTGTSSGSQSSVQEGQAVRPGRGHGDAVGQGRGSPGKGGTGQEAALAEAVRSLSLRRAEPKRYAKGTVFGGRFLPKGVSAYSAPAVDIDDVVGYPVARDRYRPERIGVGPMNSTQYLVKRPNQYSRDGRFNYIFLPGIDRLVDPKSSVPEWTRIGAFDEAGEYINGAFVKDMTVRRGRKTRIVIDADIDIARDPVAREEFLDHVRRELSLWEDLAPRKRFPRRIFVSSGPYRLPNGEPKMTVLGTADIRDKTIDIWNVPTHFGRANREMVDGKGRYAEFRMKTIDHEIAHTIAAAGGPPDRDIWEEAMARDGRHMRGAGLTGWIEPDWEAELINGERPPGRRSDGSPMTNGSDDYGITKYASMFTDQNLPGGRTQRVSPLSEDWAESVALYMSEKRTGVGPFIVKRLDPVSGRDELVRVPFQQWAPNRARLIEEYLREGTMTRGQALGTDLRPNEWPTVKERV